ncbi:hypothetical protein RI367_004526 [Sorochytrium milnesiophthora]
MLMWSYKHYDIADDLTGKVFVVTGSSAGIGLATVHALAARNATVIMACRSKDKTEPLVAEVREQSSNQNIHFMSLDLASFASIRAFVKAFSEQYDRLDCLINNAGIAGSYQGLTKDGYSLVFGTNHLGTFLLSILLLPKLKSTAPSRIVIVSSAAHRMVRDAAGFRYDRFKPETPSDQDTSDFLEYGESKLANIMFGAELAKRLQGTGVTVYSLHPGVIASDIWATWPAWLMAIPKWFMLTNEQGAYTTLYCATSPDVKSESGLFYDCCAEKKPTGLATSPQYQELSQQLWDWSVKETGVKELAP